MNFATLSLIALLQAVSFDFVWDQHPEQKVQGYRLYVGSDKTTYTQKPVLEIPGRTVTKVSSFKFPGVGTYFVSLTAYTPLAESSFSNELLISLPKVPGPALGFQAAGGAPAPSLVVSSTSIDRGMPVTVTLIGGKGGAKDWLSLVPALSENTDVGQWIYVGAGISNRTWVVTPPGAGSYQFRLYPDDGFVPSAASPTITVTGGGTPILGVSTTLVKVGTPVTVTLQDGIGSAKDWLSFALVSASNQVYTEWVYVGAGLKTRTWTVTPKVAGSYQFRLFVDDGFLRVATSPTVVVQ